MSQVELPHGALHYEESGDGAPIVFLHGYLMGARLWDPVVHLLEDQFRCLVPDLPFGAHPAPMRPDADLTTAGLRRLVADFLDALDVSDVTLVGNDSGAAIAKGVRPALRRLTPAWGDDDFMNQIATELAAFPGPPLLAWAPDDNFFPPEPARRLAAILPNASAEPIPGSRTWVMLDQPERTAA